MKKTLNASKVAVLSALLLTLSACSLPLNSGNDSQNNSNDTNNLQNDPLGPEVSFIIEDFEGEDLRSKYFWIPGTNNSTKQVTVTSIDDIRQTLVELDAKVNNGKNHDYFKNYAYKGNESNVLCLPANDRTTSRVTINNLNLSAESILIFKYKIDAVNNSVFTITGNKNQKLYEEKITAWDNNINLYTKTIAVSPDITEITFQIKNDTYNYYTAGSTNALILDDISLIEDVVSSIDISPKSAQETYLTCPDDEKIRIKARGLRVDGSVKEDAVITFSTTNGSINSEGIYSPDATGKTTVSATCGNISANTGEITVYESLNLASPITLAGETYTGLKNGEGNEITRLYNKWAAEPISIKLETPVYESMTADGFIHLKGKLNAPAPYNAVNIAIVGDNTKNEWTRYIVDKDFDLRVWLPFGTEQQIEISAIEAHHYKYSDEKGNLCNGDIKWEQNSKWSWITSLKISNIHEHSEGKFITNDGRYLYPSDHCEADSILVQNYAREVLYGLPESATNKDKVKAIHDRIVLDFYYDSASVGESINDPNPPRKEQTATATIKNRTCVCEGYANLTAAVYRYAGIPCKLIVSNELNHTWNNIYLDNRWYFCDVTWDDDSTPESEFISHNYFLLTDMEGLFAQNTGKMDHYATDVEEWIGRNIISLPQPKLPEIYTLGYWY